jgi:hypothetical protein
VPPRRLQPKVPRKPAATERHRSHIRRTRAPGRSASTPRASARRPGRWWGPRAAHRSRGRTRNGRRYRWAIASRSGTCGRRIGWAWSDSWPGGAPSRRQGVSDCRAGGGRLVCKASVPVDTHQNSAAETRQAQTSGTPRGPWDRPPHFSRPATPAEFAFWGFCEHARRCGGCSPSSAVTKRHSGSGTQPVLRGPRRGRSSAEGTERQEKARPARLSPGYPFTGRG